MMQELEGAEQVLEHAGTEMDQAGRFMLVRDPPIVVDPLDAEARVTEEGPRPSRAASRLPHNCKDLFGP